MTRRAPPWAFFWLHWAAWPVGVTDVAMANALAAAGLPVHQIAEIVAAASLAFSLEIIWAPLVDSAFTRQGWCIAGSLAMCCSVAGLLMAPWRSSSVPLLIVLSFCASSGAGIALVAAKGIMAYDVPAGQLGRASGFYTAGGIVGKSVAGAGTLWLLAHLASRSAVAGVSVGAVALAMSAILLASPGVSLPASSVLPALRATLSDTWSFIRTRAGALVAVLCIIPFGSSTLLASAIAREWSVTPDQLSGSIPFGAALGVVGAVLAGRFSVRFGPWRTYIACGWIMVVLLIALALAPRSPGSFLTLWFLHRAGGGACYAALLGLVMTSIGKGAAATKAAALWSMGNFSEGYPAFIDGRMHDHAGTTAMLLTHAGMDAAGFAVLLIAARVLGLRYRSLLAVTPAPA